MNLVFNDLFINISNNNIHIHDSFKIHKKEDKINILNKIISYYPEILNKRSFKSMLKEWRAHNILYRLGLFKKQTKHTDLEFNQNLIHKIIYFLISLIPIE